MKTLVIDFDNNIEEVEIKSARELKDNLFMYAGYFIPEDDDYAIELLERLDFSNLLEELENYFVKSFFNDCKEFFNLYEEIEKINDVDEILKYLDKLNDIYSKSGLGVKYSIK